MPRVTREPSCFRLCLLQTGLHRRTAPALQPNPIHSCCAARTFLAEPDARFYNNSGVSLLEEYHPDIGGQWRESLDHIQS
jgi:hypothetical protein